MDVRIGHIMDQLRREKLVDNTIVMFFADNGRLEARGIHWMWDTGLHVPLVITWPQQFSRLLPNINLDLPLTR